MDFTVRWTPLADQKLATLWMDGSIRADVTRAANEIDRRLRNDPDHEGESRPNGRRILFVAPLAVIYQVIPGRRLVQVLDVWQYGKTDDSTRAR